MAKDKFSMKGLNAYSKPSPKGGVDIDVVQMALDLVTVMKVTGSKKEDFITKIGKMWDDVEVGAIIPNNLKH